jgi:hypothetical protein
LRTQVAPCLDVAQYAFRIAAYHFGESREVQMTIDFAEPDRTKRSIRTKLYERGMGVLIWLAFAALGVAAIYVASLLND